MPSRIPGRLVAALLCALWVTGLPSARAKVDKPPPSSRLVLENGFEAILIPNRTAPLITSVVVVKAGSEHEKAQNNGVSHMLEHLLFNGTARRTQEQIRAEQDRFGIINNAHTDTSHTAYFVLATREMFGRALDLQTDMLFGSTLPEETFAREREIIVNEIAKDRVSDETAMSELYASRLYRPGGLSLPVIGTPETVRSITREEVLAYYRAWYVPNNMTAVIMGDFEVAEMEPLVRRYCGAAAPGLLATPPASAVNAAALGLTHTRVTGGTARLLELGAPAPGLADERFPAAWLLAALLDERLAEAAGARLGAPPAGGAASGSILEASCDLDAHPGTGTFRVTASLAPGVAWKDAAGALLDEIAARVAASSWNTAALDRLRLAERASQMRLWEKPHYFGLDRARYIAAGGWPLARDFAGLLGWVEPGDVKEMARRIAGRNAWAVFMTGADVPVDRGQVAAGGATSPTDGAEARPTPESREIVGSWKGPRAGTEGLADSLGAASPAASGAINVRTVLPNGLTIALDSTDDSRVFAAHVMAKGRSAAEPAGRTGLADLLHRVAGAGTRDHPGAELARALESIGGSLKVTDDAQIPYDDIYLSPEYTYLRLEALDEHAPQALRLLGEILAQPRIDDGTAVAQARGQLLARARQAGASPRERCRLLLAGALWGAGHPFALPLFGTEETVASLAEADLRAFHAAYFTPRNLIVGIGTSIPADRLLPEIEAALGRWGATAPRQPPPWKAIPPAAGAGGTQVAHLDAPQSVVMRGRLIPAGPRNDAALEALAAVLSRRMGERLRDRRGLAYSLGADTADLGGRVQMTAWIGVLPAKVEEARAGLGELLASLASEPPGQEEIENAARGATVRSLMRGLSRINRAHQRCLEEMRRERGGPSRPAEPPAAPSAEQVALVIRQLVPEGSLSDWSEAVVSPPPAEPSR